MMKTTLFLTTMTLFFMNLLLLLLVYFLAKYVFLLLVGNAFHQLLHPPTFYTMNNAKVFALQEHTQEILPVLIALFNVQFVHPILLAVSVHHFIICFQILA